MGQANSTASGSEGNTYQTVSAGSPAVVRCQPHAAGTPSSSSKENSAFSLFSPGAAAAHGTPLAKQKHREACGMRNQGSIGRAGAVGGGGGGGGGEPSAFSLFSPGVRRSPHAAARGHGGRHDKTPLGASRLSANLAQQHGHGGTGGTPSPQPCAGLLAHRRAASPVAAAGGRARSPLLASADQV